MDLTQFVTILSLHVAGIWKRLINKDVENFGKRLCSKLRGPRCLQLSFTWSRCTFFSLYVSFSHFSPRDVLMGVFPFFFIKYAYILHMHKTIPYSNLTWREVGKQNVPAKKSLFVAESFDFMTIVLVLKPCILAYFGLYNQLDSQVLCIPTFILELALLLEMGPPN